MSQCNKDEIREWLRCKDDLVYFAEKYCKLITSEGTKPVKLLDYQKNYLNHLESIRSNIRRDC